MDQYAALNPPQDPKQPKKKLKTIFTDDTLTIAKCRAYLQLYQELQNRIMAGSEEPPPFASQIAKLLNISEKDAQQHLEFERDYILSHPHTSIDHDGNEIPRPFDPFGPGEL